MSAITLLYDQRNIPSVRVSATRNRENGGRSSRAFRVAKAADRITKGATILKICGKLSKHTKASEE
jgi:hypothetical protein